MKLVYMHSDQVVRRGDRHKINGLWYRVDRFDAPRKLTHDTPGFVVMRRAVQDALSDEVQVYVTNIAAHWIE